MTTFTSYTLENAPEGSKEKLAQVKAAWGFVPKLHGNLAESPVALEAYDTLFGLVAKSTLTPIEQQVAYQAIKHIYYGPDWSKDIISPPAQILTDVANGKLRNVSWVTPTWANSDHAGSGSNTGPSWVTSVVNAIGESKYWDSTAIFIFWDYYGGWYDPVAPKYADYDGLGLRLPMLIISPYAKQGWVSHVHYEHGSILRFVEDQFGLGRLAASDTRAKSPAKDAFDFAQPPRTFVPIKSKYDANYFKHQPPDYHIPDAE